MDDRKCNLRFATYSQNMQNVEHRGNNMYRGVAQYKDVWKAHCREKYLGRFMTAEAAAWAYDQYVLVKYGPDSVINGVTEPSDTTPLMRTKRSNYQNGIRQDKNGKWIVRIRKGTTFCYRKVFSTFDEATTASASVRAKLEREEKESRTNIQITRNSDGEAVIKTSRGAEILVDEDTWLHLNEAKWSITKAGYVVTGNSKFRRSYMHRYIMEAKRGDIVDHINGVRNDNRKSNLRIVTATVNAANKRKKPGLSSLFHGVSAHNNKWTAACHKNGTCEYLGIYESEEVAAWVRDQRVRELYAEFANLNNVAQPRGWKYSNKRGVFSGEDSSDDALELGSLYNSEDDRSACNFSSDETDEEEDRIDALNAKRQKV